MNNDIIIGIIARDETINNTTYQAITKNNLKYLDGKCTYIGILNYDNKKDINKKLISICDSIIFQGGSDIYEYHFNLLKEAIKMNKPILGICMGHQIIGLYSNKEKEKDLKKVDNHYNYTKKHNININKNSILYNLYGSNLQVNSRHLYTLNKISKPFICSAISDDGEIESIEYISRNKCIIGVQWHPEDMDNMSKLYNYFIKKVKENKNKD